MRRIQPSGLGWAACVVVAMLLLPAKGDEGKGKPADDKQKQAQSNTGRTTVFIAAHAELDKYPPNDPRLSDHGQNRARGLRDTLRHVRLSAIYISEFRASGETVLPTAMAQKIETEQIGGPELDKLIDAIMTKHVGQYVLVVRPTREIPSVMQRLGLSDDQIPYLSPTMVDNLFVLTLDKDGGADLIRLHYRPRSPKG